MCGVEVAESFKSGLAGDYEPGILRERRLDFFRKVLAFQGSCSRGHFLQLLAEGEPGAITFLVASGFENGQSFPGVFGATESIHVIAYAWLVGSCGFDNGLVRTAQSFHCFARPGEVGCESIQLILWIG